MKLKDYISISIALLSGHSAFSQSSEQAKELWNKISDKVEYVINEIEENEFLATPEKQKYISKKESPIIKNIDHATAYSTYEEIKTDLKSGNLKYLPKHLLSENISNSIEDTDFKRLGTAIKKQAYDVIITLNESFSNLNAKEGFVFHNNLRISAATRIHQQIKALQENGNKNAITESTHLSGYTIDVDYKRYSINQITSLYTFLEKLQKEGLIQFVMEHHQPVFHIEINPIQNYSKINQKDYLKKIQGPMELPDKKNLSPKAIFHLNRYKKEEEVRKNSDQFFRLYKKIQDLI